MIEKILLPSICLHEHPKYLPTMVVQRRVVFDQLVLMSAACRLPMGDRTRHVGQGRNAGIFRTHVGSNLILCNTQAKLLKWLLQHWSAPEITEQVAFGACQLESCVSNFRPGQLTSRSKASLLSVLIRTPTAY